MTAAHAVGGAVGVSGAGAVRAPPARLLLGPATMHPHHHPHQVDSGSLDTTKSVKGIFQGGRGSKELLRISPSCRVDFKAHS